MRWLFLLWLAAGSSFSWSSGAPESAVPTRQRPPVTEALRVAGGRVYEQRCAACHGKKGDGRGWAARSSIPPRDFTTGVFKLRSTPSGTIPTDADLFATISRGMHGTPMMAWRGLPEYERWALVEQLKTFSARFAREKAEPTVAVSPEPTVAETDALRADGARLWRRRRCGACHGVIGERSPSLVLQAGASRPALVRDLSRGEFLRGTSARDIFLTLRTGMDGTPMGSYADTLSDRETWALAIYVRSLLGRDAR